MLVLSEDQRMLMESARGAVAANAPIAAFRKLRAESSGEGFSRAFWRQCAEMGWAGVLVPEAFGGIQFGVVGAGLIAREMSRTLAPTPFLSTAVIASSGLVRGGSTAQKSFWLPRITRGEAVIACALDEGARRGGPSIKASRARSGWRLDGVEHMALDGHIADVFLIAAQVEQGEATFFLVSAKAKGLERDARTLVDSHRVASVTLDGVSLDADAALAGGAATIKSTVDIGRAVVAAALCGVAEEAFARTMSYLKERRQFDRKIGSFQAMQHRAARMHIDIENSWSATLKALESLDANANSAALDVAVAKAKASDTACAATAECLQMHGGIGMTDEFDIGLFLKRARVDSVTFGDAAFHGDRVATMLGY
jgi:alkylation response protein AidB-like acyl-CoA dehydrogenase